MVLALKYRPENLKNIVGQDDIVSIIKNGLRENQLPHSILLSGIRGTGKTSTARIISKCINCTNPQDFDACGKCESCIAIQNGSHLDVVEIDAASYTGIDNIREIIESSKYKAVQGKARVFIIDEVHMLSKSAFNALLKNLEEPFGHVYYLLATTEIDRIPETILSRCMRLNFSLFSPDSLKDYLKDILKKENYAIEEEVLSEIVFTADGSLRDALTTLNQAVLISPNKKITKETTKNLLSIYNRQDCFDLLELLMSGRVNEAIGKINEITQISTDTTKLFLILLDIIYWLCCFKNNAISHCPISIDFDRAKDFSSNLTMAQLFHTWKILHSGYQEFLQSPVKNQAFSMILIRICYITEAESKKKTS